jgi:hypothetical protein
MAMDVPVGRLFVGIPGQGLALDHCLPLMGHEKPGQLVFAQIYSQTAISRQLARPNDPHMAIVLSCCLPDQLL